MFNLIDATMAAPKARKFPDCPFAAGGKFGVVRLIKIFYSLRPVTSISTAADAPPRDRAAAPS